MALVREEMQRRRPNAMKFNRLKKKKKHKKKRKQSKQSPSMNPGGKKTAQQQIPPCCFWSLPGAALGFAGRAQHSCQLLHGDQGRGCAPGPTGASSQAGGVGWDAPSAPAQPSPLPVITGNSSCTTLSRSRQGETRGNAEWSPAPEQWHGDRDVDGDVHLCTTLLCPLLLLRRTCNHVTETSIQLQSACSPVVRLETPPNHPKSLLRNSHWQMHQ